MTAPHDLPAPYAGPPLRIAWIGNGKHPWCSEVHFTKSMESLGHSITFLQEDEMDWAQLPALVIGRGIQAVFWTRTWPAEMAVVEPVLKELAAEGIPTVSYHLDRWFGLDRQHQVDDQPFFRTSLVVSPDDSPQWAEHGVNHFWLPPGVYGPECEPVDPNPRRWPYDVVFVGSHPYPHPEWSTYRTNLLSAFRSAFGRRFAILPRERRGAPIRGRDLQELYATVPVVLGDSCLAGETHRYWSDRVPETLGRGGLLIHPVVDGMSDWYSDETFMSYVLGDFVGAVDLARWAMDDREMAGAITDHGRATVLARDTYAHRMGTVLAVAEGIYGGYREVEWERASPEVERDAGVSFSARLKGELVRENGEPRKLVVNKIKGDSHPPVLARLNRWTARFDLRPGEVGEGEKIVIREVWDQDDYRAAGQPGLAGAVVVDIGANIGAFSVLAARAGARKVLAFEPDPSNYSRLTHHVTLNRAGSTVEAVNAAVTDGAYPYVRMVGLSDGAHAEPSDDPNDIPTVTLADIIGRLGKVDFIKCDTEGAEFGIFDAVPLELLSRVKRMALEWHAPVVTHLMHLRGDEFGPLVTKLAEAGRVETFGHPSRGGLIWWRGYVQ